jgi:hypothetical protein
MGGAGSGSGGVSATGTGAPPGAGGAGGQSTAPATKHGQKDETMPPPENKSGASGRQTRKADINVDPTGIAPGSRVGAAGAREDSEAGNG